MAAVSLALFKQHVRADEFSDDDVLLQHYLDTAEDYVVTYTGRTAAELTTMGGGSMPKQICQAIMLIGAHWYNQRESVSIGQMNPVPDTLQALIKQFRKLADS